MTNAVRISTVQHLSLEVLRESPTNPRKVFTGIEELAHTIQRNGVVQPIVVRPLEHPQKGLTHEIVSGARRFRASKHAGLTDVPVVVRVLTDEQAAEIQDIENLQREDLSPLEKASGFARRLESVGSTVESLATKIGKPPQYVANHLVLLKLEKSVQQALRDDRIGVAHASKIAALPPALHREALEACFTQAWQNGETQVLLPVTQLVKWIERNVLLTLADVPFDKSSAELIPAAGSCDSCRKHTGADALLFPEAKDDACMDRKCLSSKVQAHIARTTSTQPELVRISTHSQANGKDGTLGTGSYIAIEPKKRGSAKRPENRTCDHTREAIVVQGHDACAKHLVCADASCLVHHALDPMKRTQEDYRAKQRSEDRERRLQMTIRRAIGDAILKKFRQRHGEMSGPDPRGGVPGSRLDRTCPGRDPIREPGYAAITTSERFPQTG